jgi:hypothetical protein
VNYDLVVLVHVAVDSLDFVVDVFVLVDDIVVPEKVDFPVLVQISAEHDIHRHTHSMH